jgi:hypothetical protein
MPITTGVPALNDAVTLPYSDESVTLLNPALPEKDVFIRLAVA